MSKSVRESLAAVEEAVVGSESPEDFVELATSNPFILSDAKESILDAAELAKETVLARMNEKDFVQIVRKIESIIASSMAVECPAIGFLALTGDLREFTDTTSLAIIGFLIEEGVL